MSRSSGGFLSALLDIFSALFGRKPAAPPGPALPPDSNDEPAQIVTSRVLVVVYDPVMDPATGRKLSETQGWHRTEDLATRFMTDILETSGGLARYQIVQRVDADEFPVLADGFQYTPESFKAVLSGAAQPHRPTEVDYQAILQRFDVLNRVTRNEIDEVWVFGYPYAGFYESSMGGKGAFWCNAPVLKNTESCPRRFVLMGFSYERGVGEMLESFGHRCESILLKTWEHVAGEDNLWQRFIRYDKVAPGKAALGNIHFAPNSERDYDWNNPRKVASTCDDWLNFPDFEGQVRQVDAGEWGRGDMRAHHLWWLKHFPKVAGRQNGVHNNWWQYVIDPNRVGK